MMLAGLAVLTVIASGAADSLPREISLAEAIAEAQRNAPAMVAALGQERTTAAAVREAYAAFVPSLNLSMGATRQLPSTPLADPWSHSAGVGLSVDLFDGGRRILDVQQANARRGGARANTLTQRFATALSVAQSYFDALAARESESASRAQLEQAEQLLHTSIARLASHTVTRSDSLRAEIQVRAARLAVLQARTDLQVANASLTRIVGANTAVTAAPADSSADADLNVDGGTLLQMAETGPAVASARAALDAAHAARRASWTTYLPSLTAAYSRTGDDTGSSLLPSGAHFGPTGALRLSMSLAVFDQLHRESQVIQADVAEANAQAGLRDAVLAARADLTRSLGTFRTARERVASQAATLAAAEEDLRVQEQRYAIGGSTHLDVLTSQTQLEQSRRDLIRARYDLRIARAQLEALVGRIL